MTEDISNETEMTCDTGYRLGTDLHSITKRYNIYYISKRSCGNMMAFYMHQSKVMSVTSPMCCSRLPL